MEAGSGPSCRLDKAKAVGGDGSIAEEAVARERAPARSFKVIHPERLPNMALAPSQKVTFRALPVASAVLILASLLLPWVMDPTPDGMLDWCGPVDVSPLVRNSILVEAWLSYETLPVVTLGADETTDGERISVGNSASYACGVQSD